MEKVIGKKERRNREDGEEEMVKGDRLPRRGKER